MDDAAVAIALALTALVVGAVADLLYRVGQTRGIDTGIFLFWQSTIFTTGIWAVAAATGQVGDILPGTWTWGLPAGLLSYIGLYLFILSLRSGDAGVNAPVFRLNFVVAAAGGILLLNEAASLPKIAGILLAMLSVFSLLNLGVVRQDGSARQSLVAVVAASLLFGSAGVLSKQALNEGSDAVPLILTQTVSFHGSAIMYVLLTRRWRPNAPTVRFVPPISFLQLVWSVLLFRALALGEASVIFPVVQLSFVLTAVMAVVFLKEAVTRTRAGGWGLAVLAVGALALA